LEGGREKLFTFDVDVAVEERTTCGKSGVRLVVTESQPRSDDTHGKLKT